MHRQMRKKLLNVVTGIAVAAAAVVVFLPAAQAAPGTVTTHVNVRTGPGTNFQVVDTAARGERVDVQRCQGSWCYVVRSGPDGWVSANYLAADGRPVNPQQPGLSFGFTIGPNGPSFNIGVGNQPQPQPQPQPPRPPRPEPEPVAQACFYDNQNLRGISFCLKQGDRVRNLGGWNDRISSIGNDNRLAVEVCTEPDFRNCRTYATSAYSLGDFDDYIQSIRVR